MKKIISLSMLSIVYLFFCSGIIFSDNIKYYSFTIPSGMTGLTIGSGCAEVLENYNQYNNCKSPLGGGEVSLPVCLDAFDCGNIVNVIAFKNTAGCASNGDLQNVTEEYVYKTGIVVGPTCAKEINKDADDVDWYTPPPPCEVSGHPIYIRDGSKHEVVLDIDIKNPGYNLSFKRIYDSRNLGLPQPVYGNMGGMAPQLRYLL